MSELEIAHNAQRELAEKITAIEERHRELNQRFDAVVAARDFLQLEKQESAGVLEGLRERYQDLAKRYGGLVAARDYLQLEKRERGGALQGLQARYNEVSGRLAVVTAERDVLQLNNQGYGAAIEGLQARHNEVSRRLAVVIAERDALHLQKQEHGGKLEALQTQHSDLAKRFGALVSARNYLKLQLADRDGTIDGRDAYHRQATERARTLESEREVGLANIQARLGVRVSGGDPGTNVSIAIPMRDGSEQTVHVPLAPFAARPSSYFIAYAKAGSVLLDGLIRDITYAARQPAMNLYEQLFMLGYPSTDSDFEWPKLFQPNGVVYYGFRDFPNFALPLSPASQLALLVRDPRDMLVSAYYSRSASHALPAEGPHRAELLEVRKQTVALSVDEFCRVHWEEYLRSLRRNQQSGSRHASIFRYEDIIFRKPQFVADLCSIMGVQLAREEISRIARAHDLMPGKEDVGAHVRQVRPGNFRAQLSANMIAFLNDAFKEFLIEYDYPIDAPGPPRSEARVSPRKPHTLGTLGEIKRGQVKRSQTLG